MRFFAPSVFWLVSALFFALAFVQVEHVYQAFSRHRWRRARLLAGWGVVALAAGVLLLLLELGAWLLGVA